MLEVEVEKVEVRPEKDIVTEFGIPTFNIEHKENLGLYFDMILRSSPQLRFSITDKKGKEIYANLLSVENY